MRALPFPQVKPGDTTAERSDPARGTPAHAFLCAGDYFAGALYHDIAADQQAFAFKLADCLRAYACGQASDVAITLPGYTVYFAPGD